MAVTHVEPTTPKVRSLRTVCQGMEPRLGTVTLLLWALLTGCATHSKLPPLARFEFTQPEMGVPFRIVLYAATEAEARAAAEATFQRVAQLNDILSDYDTDSELSQLSRTAGQGRTVPLSEDLWNVL